MEPFAYNDNLSFFLPDWIEVCTELNEDGEESSVLNIGLYLDDDGDIQQRFKASFSTITIKNPDDRQITVEDVCEELAGAVEGTKFYVVSGSPECMFMNMPMPVSILGVELKLRRHFFAVRISRETMVAVTAIVEVAENNEKNLQFYKDMLEVARSARVDGKPLPIDGLTAEQLMQEIELSFEDDDEAIDITSAIKIEISSGDEKTTISFSENESEEMANTASGGEHNYTTEGDESGTGGNRK